MDRMLGGVEETQPRMVDVLAEITAGLVDEPDSAAVLDLVITAGMELLGAAAVGVMMVDPRGGIGVLAASDEQAKVIELLQSQIEQGPCVDCIGVAESVVVPDLRSEGRWPVFTPAALEAGYLAVAAVPMRLDGRGVGGLNLLYAEPLSLTWQVRLGQALADLAVLGMAQDRDGRRSDRLVEQTLRGLNDRVLLGQAIGLVAGTLGVSPGEARAALGGYARARGLRVREVARSLADRVLDPAELVAR